MAKILDKIVIVDVEATCWEGKTPDGMESEIIEIGICLLDVKSGEISDNRGILVRPDKSVISPIARILINMILTIARIFNPCQQKSANKISQKVIIFSSAKNYAGLNNDLEVILLDLF